MLPIKKVAELKKTLNWVLSFVRNPISWIITLFSVKISEIGTFVSFLGLLDPSGDGRVVDPVLFGRLLERVVNGELPHFFLELVETLLPSFLVSRNYVNYLIRISVFWWLKDVEKILKRREFTQMFSQLIWTSIWLPHVCSDWWQSER